MDESWATTIAYATSQELSRACCALASAPARGAATNAMKTRTARMRSFMHVLLKTNVVKEILPGSTTEKQES